MNKKRSTEPADMYAADTTHVQSPSHWCFLAVNCQRRLIVGDVFERDFCESAAAADKAGRRNDGKKKEADWGLRWLVSLG